MTEYKVDRTEWPPGPWDNEPDRAEWDHAGVPCLILRNRLGALCGYAGVPPAHPWHSLRCGDDGPSSVDVHWGLTFAGPIRLAAAVGEDLWWFGFDCSHLGDASPASHWSEDGEYRDLDFVRAEVESLAEQVADAARGEAKS